MKEGWYFFYKKSGDSEPGKRRSMKIFVKHLFIVDDD